MEKPDIEIVSRRVTMEAYAPEGEKLWRIEAENAEGNLNAEGDSVKLSTVTAFLYEKNSPAMKLTAKKGQANEATGTLELEGTVKAVSLDGNTTLTCDRITWQRDNRTLVATGRVTGTTSGLTIGPAERATAKFRQKEDTMNNAAIAALTLVSLTVKGPQITYKDKAGNLDVRAATFEMTRVSEDVYSFTSTGPLVAKWLKQGLTVSGQKMEGTMARVVVNNVESFELREGTFSGNITSTLDGPRGKMTVTGLSVFRMRLGEDGRTWNFSGDGAPFTATLPDSGAVVTGRHFEGTADRNRVGTQETPEWQTGVFTGGVTATVTQTDKRTGKKFTVTGKSPTVQIDRKSSTVTLLGGVTISGDHPAMGPAGAEMTAPKIVLEFDAEMRDITKVRGG